MQLSDALVKHCGESKAQVAKVAALVTQSVVEFEVVPLTAKLKEAR